MKPEYVRSIVGIHRFMSRGAEVCPVNRGVRAAMGWGGVARYVRWIVVDAWTGRMGVVGGWGWRLGGWGGRKYVRWIGGGGWGWGRKYVRSIGTRRGFRGSSRFEGADDLGAEPLQGPWEARGGVLVDVVLGSDVPRSGTPLRDPGGSPHRDAGRPSRPSRSRRKKTFVGVAALLAQASSRRGPRNRCPAHPAYRPGDCPPGRSGYPGRSEPAAGASASSSAGSAGPYSSPR